MCVCVFDSHCNIPRNRHNRKTYLPSKSNTRTHIYRNVSFFFIVSFVFCTPLNCKVSKETGRILKNKTKQNKKLHISYPCEYVMASMKGFTDPL